jgi:predicted RNA-binding protein with RPS1 domain
VDGFLLVSSINKTYLHDIAEILNIESGVNTIDQTKPSFTINNLRKKRSGK